VAWLARRLDRPVRWAETRAEHMIAAGHGRGQWQEAELGGTRDGRVLAYRLSVVQDTGAYPRIGAILPFWTRTMLTGPYQIAKAKFTAASVVTTTTPVGSYRGAGQPEAVAALERMMDRYAAEIGMDPAEVRRRNLIPNDRFPWTALTRAAYDTGDYEAALDRVLAAADYPALRAVQRVRRAGGGTRQLGIGLSVFAELTGADARDEYGAVEVHADGRVVVYTGTCGSGQGHATTWAMLVADVLGVPVERISLVQGDTRLVPSGGGTGGSRSLQTGGLAARQAAQALVTEALDRAGALLGGGPVDFDPESGRFRGGSHDCGWADVAAAAGGALRAAATYTPSGGTCSFGAHLAVVEVDTETGRVEVTRIVAVDDAGVIVNPLLAEGQIHGGLAQGIGQALTEEVGYTADGQPVHRDLGDYAFICAAELPSFETVSMQTATPVNPLGVKGLGESGTVGVPPAVQNAVVDALSHLGVRHIDMPVTPEKVWRAIQRAADPA
jgi:aerobic carbon-monoxide dehydrogenase large subunit